MSDLRERIEDDENAFQRLLEAIPGFDGYREREIRRTADKLVRDQLVTELDRVREALKGITAQWVRASRLPELPEIDRLARLLGKVRDNIRFADYGYTGFFDAIKIKEDQLDKLYEYDLSLRTQIAACSAAVSALGSAATGDAAPGVQAVEAAIGELQDLVDRREEVASSLVAETS
jgi:hypothetical protein